MPRVRSDAKNVRLHFQKPRRAFAGIVCAFVSCGLSAMSLAADATINVKQPYHIAYDLSPIRIDVKAKGSPDLSYHIYDAFKNELAQGRLADSVRQTVTFTPPAYGWYIIECGTYAKDHMTSGTAKFIGVTPRYANMHTLEAGQSRGGWNDEAMQAFTGLMMDRTNTRMGFQNADRVIADCKKYGVNLLMQFEAADLARDLKHVREWVTRYKGRVRFWEVVNEPNLSLSAKAYADILKQVYPLIKRIDPAAVVMGPATCGIQMSWCEEFYKVGGGKHVDAISIHDYEGNESIDLFHWNHQMGELRKLMSRNGDAAKEIWQTERAISGLRHGFVGPTQALRMSLQRDIMETWGIPNHHNNHYYVSVTGYMDVPTFVISESGPHPAALVCRTRAAMIGDRRFEEKIDLGPTGNKIFLALRYQGSAGTNITLRNLGCLDLPLEVKVSSGSTLTVVDAFGNARAVPVKHGKASVLVSQWPCYLQPASDQQVSFTPWNFGQNIASEATFEYSGGTQSPSKILTDGLFQGNYTTAAPWGPDWRGTYSGRVFNETPQTLDISFGQQHTIEKLLIYSAHADNSYSTLLDYDLQYHGNSGWVTIDKVRTPCPPSDIVNSFAMDRKMVMWYQDNNFFVHQFEKPINTDKLRLVVRRITRGCVSDMIAEDALNVWASRPANDRWTASSAWLQLREIEIYKAKGN